MRLAIRRPDVEWVVVGKNSEFETYGFPPNVTNLWPDSGISPIMFTYEDEDHRCAACKEPTPYDQVLRCCATGRHAQAYHDWVAETISFLDGMVVNVGQHGNTHSSMPPSNKTWASGVRTNTYVWARNYGRYMLEGLNKAGDKTDGEFPVAYVCPDPRN